MTGGLSKQTGAPLAAALINGAANKKMGPRGKGNRTANALKLTMAVQAISN